MSALYGKLWAEGHPGQARTKAAHREINAQVLYDNARREVAVEVEMHRNDDDTWTLWVDTPAVTDPTVRLILNGVIQETEE